jgi:fluoride ion exporter CrcB/FEX
VNLLNEGDWLLALLNVSVSVVGGVALAWAGQALARI